MSSEYSVTRFEKFIANWVFKFVGLLFSFVLLLGMFAPSVVLYVFLNGVLGMNSAIVSAVSTVVLGGWWWIWVKIGTAPQGKVIYVVMNIFLAMLLHSERHRYFLGWDFEKPIREQIHSWHG